MTNNELTNEQISHRLQSRLADARSDVKTAAQAIASAAENITGRITRTLDATRTGRRLNDLGELQGSGPAFDMAVAKLTAARQRYAELREIAGWLGVPEFASDPFANVANADDTQYAI